MRSYVGSKVVQIGSKYSGGTGFHVKGATGKTYIATNGHICLMANENDTVNVFQLNDDDSIRRRVLYRHPTHDICIVEALPGVNGLTLGSYPYTGETVGLIGHPGLRPLSLSLGEIIGDRDINLIFGMNIKESHCIGEYYVLKESLKKKELTKEEREIELMMLYYGADNICLAFDLPSKMFNGIAYGGNSGSPVVNFWGNIVGVLYAGGRQPTDSYLVPLIYLKQALEKF
jgi:hypothetical protein